MEKRRAVEFGNGLGCGFGTVTGKTSLLRVLPPFTNNLGGITRCIKSGLYSFAATCSIRFFADLVGKGPEIVEEVVQTQTMEEVLRRWGFDDTHVTNIFQRRPSLRNAVAAELESKLNLLSKLGVTSSDCVKMIHNHPRIINFHISINFDTQLEHLQSLFGSKELLVKAMVRNPALLLYKVREKVEPVFALYERMGVSKVDLVSMLVLRPTLFPRTRMCEEKLEYIRRIGVTKESKMFKYVVTIMGVSRISTIREKIANLEKFGIPEDEVLQFFGRTPVLMTLSVDKIQRNMTFVVDMMKLPPTTVLRNPHLLLANLENSLKPRMLLAGKIQEMDLEPQMKGCLVLTALRMTEKRFLKVFIACHEKAVGQELLAYYRASQGIKRSAASSKKNSDAWGFFL